MVAPGRRQVQHKLSVNTALQPDAGHLAQEQSLGSISMELGGYKRLVRDFFPALLCHGQDMNPALESQERVGAQL